MHAWIRSWTKTALALFLTCWAFGGTLLVLAYRRDDATLGAYGLFAILGAAIFIEGPWWRRFLYLALAFMLMVAITIAGDHLGWSETA